MKNLYIAFSDLCSTWLTPIVNLWARIHVGLIFWRSGVAKFEDMETTIELFDAEEDGEFALPFLPAEPAAYLATFGELVLPILLVLGLFTRVGAAGLFVMAAVIFFFIEGNPQQPHLWMIICALLTAQGGSKLSIDHFLFKR